MGWLRNLFSTIARGFAWIADAWTFVYNISLRIVHALWGRLVLMIAPMIVFLMTVHKIATFVAAPIRQFFIDGAHAGLHGGSLDVSRLVCDWVGVLNYYFPLDEMFTIIIYMTLIILGMWAYLSIFRFIKNLIGGWS